MSRDTAVKRKTAKNTKWTISSVSYKHGHRKVITPTGQFVVERCLNASGSFGFLFVAKMGQRTVLIKQQVLDQSAYCEAALRELSVLVYLSEPNLRHANIINLLRVWHTENCLYLVLPTLECSLDKYTNEKPVPFQNRTIIYTQIISALRHLHHCDILHRDLRSENIVLMRDCSQVKLIDFGASRLSTSSKQTPGKYVSTFSSRAPECEGGMFSKASDIWSFGCLLSELISGKPLFDDEGSVFQDRYRVATRIQNLPGNPTPHERLILERTLTIDPLERIPTDDLYEIHFRYVRTEKPHGCTMPKISYRDVNESARYAPRPYKFRDLRAMHENIESLIRSFNQRKYLQYTTNKLR